MDLTIYIGAIGALAFLVSIITEVTKNIGFLKRIPTDLQVIVLSVGLSLLAFFGYADYAELTIVWYMVAGAVIGGLLAAFVAMYGWATFMEMWERFKPKGDAE